MIVDIVDTLASLVTFVNDVAKKQNHGIKSKGKLTQDKDSLKISVSIHVQKSKLILIFLV
jgi:hypothetical protein